MQGTIKPVTEVLDRVNTVGELIKQLQQFDEDTIFTPYQRAMHIKCDDKEMIVFIEIKDVV
ncbi:MAG: hypothetical protein EOO01_33160 [Chitinophagaceae bacterium]|nr:MAG: hypothetical protein EOO01_33160 [Chitinophagaceae bacterium]